MFIKRFFHEGVELRRQTAGLPLSRETSTAGVLRAR